MAHIPLVNADGKTKPEKAVSFTASHGLMRDPFEGMLYVCSGGLAITR